VPLPQSPLHRRVSVLVRMRGSQSERNSACRMLEEKEARRRVNGLLSSGLAAYVAGRGDEAWGRVQGPV